MSSPDQRAREAARRFCDCSPRLAVHDDHGEDCAVHRVIDTIKQHARSEVRLALEEAQERSKALEGKWGYSGGAFKLSREDLRALAVKYEEGK